MAKINEFKIGKKYVMDCDRRSDWAYGTFTFVEETDDGFVFDYHREADDEHYEADETVTLDNYQASLLRNATMYALRNPDDDPSWDGNPFDYEEAYRLYYEWHGLPGANDMDDVSFDDIFVEAD